jgi:hypothetical protein
MMQKFADRLNASLADLGLLDRAHRAANVPINLTLDRLHVTSLDQFWEMALDCLAANEVVLAV